MAFPGSSCGNFVSDNWLSGHDTVRCNFLRRPTATGCVQPKVPDPVNGSHPGSPYHFSPTWALLQPISLREKNFWRIPKGKTSGLPGQQLPGSWERMMAVLNWMIPVATPILSFQAGALLQAVGFLGARVGRFGGFRQSGQVKRFR